MNKYEAIIDYFFANYSTYDNGKLSFEYEYGELIFFKKNPTILTLFGIYIHPEYRQHGICRNVLQYLIDKKPHHFKKLCVQSVLSKVLYEYLLRFEYKNKRFKNQVTGFFYELN
jgi:hypothetical protein